MLKFFFYSTSLLFLLSACRNDEITAGEILIGFEYDGPKIDSTNSNDRIIFTNFDGSPVIEVPNAFPNACQSYTNFGTHEVGDTLTWHLRLIPTDGGPQTFQVLIDETGKATAIQHALSFYNPFDYDFVITQQTCGEKNIILIKN